MYNVLIVDDEIYAVKGLRSGLDWGSLQIENVYEAYHAQMAQDILKVHPINFMICDIEMPEGSGLELMEWAKDHAPHVETIVLTCHAEFAYAQKAIQLGGFDYLLKPVIFADLKNVLERMKAFIADKRRADEIDEKVEKYVQLWNNHKPLLIERFWQEILSKRILPSQKSIQEASITYDLEPNHISDIALVLLSVEQWDKELDDRDEEIMTFAVCKAAEEIILQGTEHGCVLKDQDGNLVVIVYAGEKAFSPDELQRRCVAYIQACNQYFYCKLSCYYGDIYPISHMIQLYHELLNEEYLNVTRGNEVLYRAKSHHPMKSSEELLASNDFLTWADLLESGDSGAIKRMAAEALENGRGKVLTADTLTVFYHALLQIIYHVLHRNGLSVQFLYEEHRLAEASSVTKSIAHFQQWVNQLIDAVSERIAVKGPINSVVVSVQAFVEKHLDQELAREEIASHVHLNPAYLSRLFRKETGMVLSDYILQARMKQAANLLSKTNKSISEVADSLGYGNFSYFSRLFRKTYGMTPLDYRKAKN